MSADEWDYDTVLESKSTKKPSIPSSDDSFQHSTDSPVSEEIPEIVDPLLKTDPDSIAHDIITIDSDDESSEHLPSSTNVVRQLTLDMFNSYTSPPRVKRKRPSTRSVKDEEQSNSDNEEESSTTKTLRGALGIDKLRTAMVQSSSSPNLLKQNSEVPPHTSSRTPVKLSDSKSKNCLFSERIRPLEWNDYFGQTHTVFILKQLLESKAFTSSLIFFGPPGCGKSTLAHIIANALQFKIIVIRALSLSLSEVKKTLLDAKQYFSLTGSRTCIILEEIHRWNKLQQDMFLPFMEDGSVFIIGTTTENPSFECTTRILSRCRVYRLEKLEINVIESILKRGMKILQSENPTKPIECAEGTLTYIAEIIDGDARLALNCLESVFNVVLNSSDNTITNSIVKSVWQRSQFLYDKNGNEHYACISALHKSLRGSDANASLYWMARMIAGGDNPRYIARRLIRFAVEDIGIADPAALPLAVSAFQTVEFLGSPECEVALAELVIYLARAPKGIVAYEAWKNVLRTVHTHPNLPVPMHLINASTTMMEEMGYGKDYQYNPKHEGPITQTYLPPELLHLKFIPDESNSRIFEDNINYYEGERKRELDEEGLDDEEYDLEEYEVKHNKSVKQEI